MNIPVFQLLYYVTILEELLKLRKRAILIFFYHVICMWCIEEVLLQTKRYIYVVIELLAFKNGIYCADYDK